MTVSKNTPIIGFLLFNVTSIGAAESNDLSDPFQMDGNTVNLVTPSLLSPSKHESPVSVSKLYIADLELLGVYNVVDALRLVPGMLVADEFGSGSVVGYHGTNVNVPRRMEVLYNGASLYRPGYSGLSWQRLPLDVADLSSIEVIRGASVVDFGSNAFQSTVNFIQKPVATMPSAKAEYTVGENESRIWVGGKYGYEDGQIFIRYFQEDTDGYDLSNTGRNVIDDSLGKNLLVNGILSLGNNMLLDFSLLSKRYEFNYPGFLGVDVQNTLALANNYVTQSGSIEDDSDNFVFKLSGNNNIAAIPTDWSVSINYTNVIRNQPIRSCQPAYVFDPLLAKIDSSPNIHLVSTDFELMFTSGFYDGNVQIRDSIVNPLNQNDLDLLLQLGQRMLANGIEPSYIPICGQTNTDVDEGRIGINSRAKLTITDDLVFSGAVEFRRDSAKSETYLGGETNSNSYNLSSSLQYMFDERNIFNLGVMFEDNDRTESALSYRVSYIRQLTSNQSMHFTHSVSERLPDIYETERFWQFYFQFDDGFIDYNGQREATFFRTSQSPEVLEAEQNESFEIGYQLLGDFNRYNLDLKIFKEKYSNMISEPFDFFNFNLTNNGQNELIGFEAAGDYQFSFAKMGMSYLYLDSNTQTPFERTLYSRHSGSVWAIIPISANWFIGGTLTGNSDIGGTSHIRKDITITHKTSLFDTYIKTQLIVRRHPPEFRTFTEFSESSPHIVRYEKQTQAMINISMEF